MSTTDRSRIPNNIRPFNSYINNTERYLLLVPPTVNGAVPPPMPHWQRLGMIMPEMESWTNFKNEWNALYSKYSDKQESRTTAIKNKLRGVQKAFKAFAMHLLTMMAGIRTVTDDDAAVLNFAIHRKNPTHRITSIDQTPAFSASPIGGAEIKFSFRPTHDSTRAGKLQGATAIEIRYEVGEVYPTDPMGCSQIFSSTKPIFILKLPNNTRGKIIHICARWIVVNNPKRNGPWSGMLHLFIA